MPTAIPIRVGFQNHDDLNYCCEGYCMQVEGFLLQPKPNWRHFISPFPSSSSSLPLLCDWIRRCGCGKLGSKHSWVHSWNENASWALKYTDHLWLSAREVPGDQEKFWNICFVLMLCSRYPLSASGHQIGCCSTLYGLYFLIPFYNLFLVIYWHLCCWYCPCFGLSVTHPGSRRRCGLTLWRG